MGTDGCYIPRIKCFFFMSQIPATVAVAPRGIYFSFYPLPRGGKNHRKLWRFGEIFQDRKEKGKGKKKERKGKEKEKKKGKEGKGKEKEGKRKRKKKRKGK